MKWQIVALWDGGRDQTLPVDVAPGQAWTFVAQGHTYTLVEDVLHLPPPHQLIVANGAQTVAEIVLTMRDEPVLSVTVASTMAAAFDLHVTE